MKLLIGITGKKRTGKNSFADTYERLVGPCNRVAFADALKIEVACACGVSVEYIEKNKHIFRPILQWWGTDFRRNLFGQDYWIKKVEQFVCYSGSFINLITDVRFLNEAAWAEKKGGVIVKITNSRCDDGDNHSSETELEKIQPNVTIDNSGTLEEFEWKIKELIKSKLI